MAELGRRMGLSTREARRALRRLERSRQVRLLFDSRTERQGRLWTTDALLQKYCRELVDRPKRALQEARAFKRGLTEKIEDLSTDVDSLKAQTEQELSELRARLAKVESRGLT
jgi:hypothetical protein